MSLLGFEPKRTGFIPLSCFASEASTRGFMPRKDLKTLCFQVPKNPKDFLGRQPILRLSEADYAVRYITGPGYFN